MESSTIFDYSELLDYVEPKESEIRAVIESLHRDDFTLSYSSISAFAISPRAFIAYKVKERKETDAMLLGTVVHCLILEADTFASRYVVGPNVNALTLEGKEAWAEFALSKGVDVPVNEKGKYVLPKLDDLKAEIKAASGVQVITGKMYEDAHFRVRCAVKNSAFQFVLSSITQTEVDTPEGFTISVGPSNYRFKGRIDGQGEGVRMDIKNVRSAQRHDAARAIQYGGMALQAYIYEQAYGVAEYYICCIDATGETSVHRLSRKMILDAGEQLEGLLTAFERAISDSFDRPEIWTQSQDFWLRSGDNPFGIHNFI
jgi:hypothetical protein